MSYSQLKYQIINLQSVFTLNILLFYFQPAYSQFLTVTPHSIHSTHITLYPLFGDSAMKPIQRATALSAGQTAIFDLSDNATPGEYLVRYDYTAHPGVNPYPSEQHVLIGKDGLSIELNPMYAPVRDSVRFSRDGGENDAWLDFQRKCQEMRAPVVSMGNWLMEEPVSKNRFYRIALKNYAQRLAQYNQWVDAQIKLQGNRFVTRLMTYDKLPSALSVNAEASGCSSTHLIDLNLQDTLVLHTRNFFDWALACVRVAYEQSPISTNRDSAVLASAEALLDRISIGHPLVYGAIVDQLFLQFTRIGFDSGIAALGNHINRTTCASARKDDITRKLAFIGRLRPGSSMFDINVPMKEGPSLPLSKLTQDKPLSLILFWSAGCSHCMELIEGMLPKMSSPEINARLQVIAVSLDRSDADRQKWQQTIARLPSWRHSILSDGPNHPLAQAFGVLATPTMFLIEGKEFRLKALPSGLGELQKLLKP
jgi:hypothetical protein